MGNNFVYAMPEASYHPEEFRGELLWVPREVEASGDQLNQGIPCLLLQHPGASRLVIYFHANAEDLGQIYVQLRYLRSFLKVHVLAVEYAGYGVCSGAPCETTLLADAESVLWFVRDKLEVPLSRLIFMGRSLGGGSAIYLASKYKCAGIVTIAAFSSIRAIVGSLASIVGWVVDEFDNETRMRSVRCPTLIIHGSQDPVISVNQAQALVLACGAEAEKKPVWKLSIRRGVDHNNFDMKQDIVQPVLEAFPDLQEGETLNLTEIDLWFSWQPRHLAPDVLTRVPYAPSWKPIAPPFKDTTIIGQHGDQI